jgi:hypothetical protein
MNRKRLVVGLVVGSAFALVVACSSSSSPPPSETPDAQADVSTTPIDASGVVDATMMTSSDAADASACANPPDPVGYMHTWQPPNVQKGKCTAAQLDDLKNEYFGPSATPSSRMTFEMNNPDCAACVITNNTDSSQGAVTRYVGNGQVFNPNIAGCVALVDGDLSANGCGAKIQADKDCETVTCFAACGVHGSADIPAFNACVTVLQSGGTCAPYFEAGSSCFGSSASHNACTSGSYPTSADYFRFLADLFCGPASDGGDAGADADDSG